MNALLCELKDLPATKLRPLVVDFEDMTSQQLRQIICKENQNELHTLSQKNLNFDIGNFS